MLLLGSSATGTNHLHNKHHNNNSNNTSSSSRKLQCASNFGIIWSNLLAFFSVFFCCQFLFCLSLTSFNLFFLIVVCFVALSASASPAVSSSSSSFCFECSAYLSLLPVVVVVANQNFFTLFAFGVCGRKRKLRYSSAR